MNINNATAIISEVHKITAWALSEILQISLDAIHILETTKKMNIRYVCVVDSEIPKTWTTGHSHSSLFVVEADVTV